MQNDYSKVEIFIKQILFSEIMADKDEILAKAKALLSSRGNNSNEKRLGSGSSGREERLLPGDEPQAVLNSAARVLLQPRRELDVYIAFDTTYSMQPYIDAVRRNIGTVTDELLGQGLRISINGVSDHSCGETYLQTNALTISPAEVKLSLDKMVIETTSNDDVPEAYECLALNLAERIPVESAGNKRAVILIGDSIPHGMKQDSYTDYGCPLKVDYAAAFRAMKKLCDGFYFVGCDKSNYELQSSLSPERRSVLFLWAR